MMETPVAAVVSTGWADRIFDRGDAHLKLGRTIWVVFCWFFSAFIAALATGLSATIIYHLGALGIVIGIIVNLTTRSIMKRRADAQEQKMQDEANLRKKQIYEASGKSKDQEMLFATDTDSDEM